MLSPRWKFMLAWPIKLVLFIDCTNHCGAVLTCSAYMHHSRQLPHPITQWLITYLQYDYNLPLCVKDVARDTQATTCCILASYQGLSLKSMWAGSHYYYYIIHQPQDKFGSQTRKTTPPMKEARNVTSVGWELVEETYFSWPKMHWVVPNRHATQHHRCIQKTRLQ